MLISLCARAEKKGRLGRALFNLRANGLPPVNPMTEERLRETYDTAAENYFHVRAGFAVKCPPGHYMHPGEEYLEWLRGATAEDLDELRWVLSKPEIADCSRLLNKPKRLQVIKCWLNRYMDMDRRGEKRACVMCAIHVILLVICHSVHQAYVQVAMQTSSFILCRTNKYAYFLY